MRKKETSDGLTDAHDDGPADDTSGDGRGVSPALAVPRPASVSFRASSIEQILAMRRADSVSAVAGGCL